MLIRKEFAEDGVLIELYWNVNIIQRDARNRHVGFGINRTILECKCQTGNGYIHTSAVLIELYWNVNSLLNAISIFSSPVLIELYWNVNKSKKKKSTTPASVLIELYWNVNRWRKQRMC